MISDKQLFQKRVLKVLLIFGGLLWTVTFLLSLINKEGDFITSQEELMDKLVSDLGSNLYSKEFLTSIQERDYRFTTAYKERGNTCLELRNNKEYSRRVILFFHRKDGVYVLSKCYFYDGAAVSCIWDENGPKYMFLMDR